MVLGDIGDRSRHVARLESHPGTDFSVDAIAESAHLNREVVGEIVSSETLDFRLRFHLTRSVTEHKAERTRETHGRNDVVAGNVVRRERGQVKHFSSDRDEHVVGIVGVRMIIELLRVVDVLFRALRARRHINQRSRENEVAERLTMRLPRMAMTKMAEPQRSQISMLIERIKEGERLLPTEPTK